VANQCSTRLFVLVSRVFAPAPGSESRTRVANMSVTTPFAKPQGLATRVGRTCASPRLRQSLAALGFGYGLNEKAPGSGVMKGIDNMSVTTPLRKASGTFPPGGGRIPRLR
jgi:hypothetical protein